MLFVTVDNGATQPLFVLAKVSVQRRTRPSSKNGLSLNGHGKKKEKTILGIHFHDGHTTWGGGKRRLRRVTEGQRHAIAVPREFPQQFGNTSFAVHINGEVMQSLLVLQNWRDQTNGLLVPRALGKKKRYNIKIAKDFAIVPMWYAIKTGCRTAVGL